MRIQRAAPANELLAKLVFLLLPTAVVAFFLLRNLNEYFSFLQNSGLIWTIYFSVGMLGSAVFHGFRFRAAIPFLALLFFIWVGYKGIDLMAIGEFDQPVLEAKYKVLSVLFLLGWVVGWGFVRLRYWSIFIAAVLLLTCIYIIAKFNADTVNHLVFSFAPALLYAIYIIFAAEQIYNYGDKNQKFWWFLGKRLAAFILLCGLVLVGVLYLMSAEIKETVANYGAGGKEGKNSMLKQNKDGSFDLKNYSQLRSQLGRSNELLFCARIDNFFPNTDIPNPLYLTAFYYTRFDTSTETFERDSIIPRNDLFEPNPSSLSLFASRTDSSVLRNSGTDLLGKTVEIQVYSRKLSPSTYLAPHTGYFVQPITVDKDFRDSFKYAFRAKSYVSELNSAYFVYNAKDEEIKKFQKQRFDVLRTAGGYEKEPADFMKYYTYMPGDEKFKRISTLAHQLTAQAKTPVDKVIALRDWFLSKDSAGQPLFRYTDNPGIPDIPNASKLLYFLFENHKGYCAYYAGATLFMLRSLGIPSRIAVGFLTMDRSGGKNKGWYWYYADQAHAWVQVYFPGFGWLDFDTTVGNDDAQQSPQPDGTPPMQPPKAYLAADGIVESIDTNKKLITYKTHRFLLQDKEFKLKPTEAVLDVHIAAIRRDTIDIALAEIKAGDSITAVSYAEAFKNLRASEHENANQVLARFPKPEPIDEVYLKRKDYKQTEKAPTPPVLPQAFDWRRLLWSSLAVVAGLALLFILLPVLVLAYYQLRVKTAGTSRQKAYWSYRSIGFYLHQLGFPRGTQTPMQYARQTIDPKFDLGLSAFMNLYLKQKYAQQDLTEQEANQLVHALPVFYKKLRAGISFSKRFSAFLRPLRTLAFFVAPSEEQINDATV
ncbi:MAG: transglutaminase domain-containing protein [Bacteroidetes bacterium]|nr:transglutaminase domain-containing protein [Bacteroidota bacterium]